MELSISLFLSFTLLKYGLFDQEGEFDWLVFIARSMSLSRIPRGGGKSGGRNAPRRLQSAFFAAGIISFISAMGMDGRVFTKIRKNMKNHAKLPTVMPASTSEIL